MLSLERFQILHLESGTLDEVLLCDQTYSINEIVEMLKRAGFANVAVFPQWDGEAIYDAQEWIVFVAVK